MKGKIENVGKKHGNQFFGKKIENFVQITSWVTILNSAQKILEQIEILVKR